MAEQVGYPPIWRSLALPIAPLHWIADLPANHQFGVNSVGNKVIEQGVTLDRLRPRYRPLRMDDDSWLKLCTELISLIRSHGNLRAYAQPVLLGYTYSEHQSPLLPILTASREVLARAGISLIRLPQILAEDFVLEYFDRLEASGDPRWPLAACDIALTYYVWHNSDPLSGSLEMMMPLNMSLSRSLEALVHARLGESQSRISGDMATATSMRLGSTGATMTLEAAGEPFGVTRERVRQVEMIVTEPRELMHRPLPLPRLARIITNLELGQLTRTQILTEANDGEPFSPEAFDSLLRLADLSPEAIHPELGSLSSAGVKAERIAASKQAREVIGVAKSLIGKLGFTRISTVAEQLGNAFDASKVVSVLEREPHWHVLEDGWVYFESSSKHMFRGTINRMLGADSPLSVESMHAGFERYVVYRRCEEPPPKSVMANLLQKHPDFNVDRSGQVSLISPDQQDRSTIEFQIVDAILETPERALHRNEIIEQLTAIGKKGDTVRIFLQYSPLLTPVGSGVYGVIGATTTPDEAARIQERASNIAVKGSCLSTITSDGVTLDITISSTAFSTGVISPPRASRAVIGEVRYEVLDSAANHVSTANLAGDGMILTGLGRVFTYGELRPGDSLRLRFVPDEAKAYLETVDG